MESVEFSDIFDDVCWTQNELDLIVFRTENTDSQLQTQIIFIIFLAALMSKRDIVGLTSRKNKKCFFSLTFYLMCHFAMSWNIAEDVVI